MSGKDMAIRLARNVKAGACTRQCAINILRQSFDIAFVEAIIEIDIAIGELNSGEE